MTRERKFFSKEELTPEQIERRNRMKLKLRIISCAMFIIAMIGITYLLYPVFKGVGSDDWLSTLEERLSGYGSAVGFLLFILIQALQVLVAVIPAVQIVGGVLYGWFIGSLASFAGILLGTLAVWGIVKKLGAPLVEAVVSEKHLKRFGFLEDERRLILILVILFLIPGIPKDVVTYIVPLTKVKLRDFLLCVLPWRFPSILLSAAFGSNVKSGHYAAAIVFISVIVIIAVAGVVFKNKILEFLSRHSRRGKLNK